MFALSRNRRNLLAIALLLVSSPFLYSQLNKTGFVPPVSYFFSKSEQNPTVNLTPTQEKLLNYTVPINTIVPGAIDKFQTAILIDKSNYQLTLYYRNKAIKSYPVVLGQSPRGDKRQEGDFKTPEGVFKIRDLYPHRRWSKFIWLDYPTQESWHKHLQDKKQGKISLTSRVGSEIGIHGVPKGSDNLVDERNNWTWGCISLKNDDVNEIYEVVQKGTPIKITP